MTATTGPNDVSGCGRQMHRSLLNLVVSDRGGTGLIVLETARLLYAAVLPFDPGRPIDLDGEAVERLDRLDITRDGDYFVAVGDPERADVLAGRLAGVDLTVVIHPTAFVAPSARLGQNVFVGAQVLINSFARIGNRVFVNGASAVDHHCVVEDDCFLGTGVVLPGGVHVGAGSFIGAGAVCKPDVKIGAGCVVGAGAVVVGDLAPRTTYVGNPARPIGAHSDDGR